MHILTPPPGLDCYRAGHGDESNIGCSPSPAPLIQLLARMGRKLDLSKLTDEEAKHVWEVVQRDFDLRKKEEERLEELKCKIEKEGTKRELLSNQSHLNETHCVHCLQPFKFLVNSKRQCLDCHFYTCKNCSRYNKKEQAWICDPCRLSRIVKIGSLEWYYEHVRSRFKRFGSAKVMRSLYGRLQHGQKMNPTLLGLHDRVYSLPDINSECQLRAGGGVRSDSDDEDDLVDGAEAEHYTRMRKTKRLLSVHPFDFDMDSEYSAQSRRQSVQLSQTPVNQDGHQSFPDFPDAGEDTSRKETLIAEADLAAVFHQILQEQGQHMTPPEQEFSTEVRLTVNSRRKSLERNPKPDHNPCPELPVTRTRSVPKGSPWNEQHRPQYSPDMDTSDEDVKGAQKIPVYQPHHVKRRNRASSQENINHSGNQSPAPESHTDPDVEEEELKRKLEELASNISDKGVSSEEEEEKKKDEPKPELSSSSSDPPSDAQKVSTTAGKTSRLDQTPRDLEERARHSRTTDSELSELEDKVASAAVQMQRAESEVSDIESRIAALSAAGLTVKPVEKPKKKYSTQLIMLQPPRNAGSDQGDLSTDSSEMASPNDFKVMSMPQVLRRKFNSSLEIADGDESFDRNSIYRGSLTQRNPNGKNRKADRIFAKPVMTHRP
ncbi:melanophilin isoform X3 [Chelonoidis abingdonii]|uniref:melanophilin isoform X3 n=1 Tax=Chelonoidis abingdonii TaxID=106734 RepID=UPI0013F1B5B6|nr:melanophilin isoform X3 [Chelonoidis abingdonii]